MWDNNVIKYMAYGQEECPDTKRKHWQGFLVFHKKKTLAGAKKYNGKWHWEVMKGSLQQNERYCSKEGKYKEHGEKPVQGERTDIQEAVADIANGKRKADDILLSDARTWVKCHKALERAEDIYNRTCKRTEATTIVWIYGPTGTGKSHTVNEVGNYYKKPLGEADLKWWDGYTGQENVWLDDFRGQIKYDELLRLADKWPMDVSRRNRQPIPFVSKTIYITSCLRPEEVYCRQNEKDSIEQLLRRIKETKYLTIRHVQ